MRIPIALLSLFACLACADLTLPPIDPYPPPAREPAPAPPPDPPRHIEPAPAPPPPSRSPAPVPEPGLASPGVHGEGDVRVAEGAWIDLDAGRATRGERGSDLRLRSQGRGSFRLSPGPGVRLALFGRERPGYGDCFAADLRADPVDLLQRGDWLCAESGRGRLARVKLHEISRGDAVLRYRSWREDRLRPEPKPPAPPPGVPEVHREGRFSVPEGSFGNLDKGASTSGEGADFEFRRRQSGGRFLVPIGAARVVNLGVERPSYASCRDAGLASDRIQVNQLSAGDWLCFRTLAGRLARARVDGPIAASPNGVLHLRYRTWRQAPRRP